ncbi:MAG TPA: hypothetical protein VNN79_15465 [Actinomycetota bacterium]|nr:hypothetical protein [Actinomycetota bacterium]
MRGHDPEEDPSTWRPTHGPEHVLEGTSHYEPGTHQLGYDTHVHLAAEELKAELKFQEKRRAELKRKIGREGPGF